MGLTKLGKYRKMDTDLKWLDLETFNTDDRQKIKNTISHFIKAHPNAVMDHDLDWLSTKCGPDKSVKAFVSLARDETLIGYAPFFVHPSALSFSLFGVSMFNYRVNRYTITAQPLVAEHYPESEELLQSLFKQLREILSSRDVLFGLGVPFESTFGQFLANNDLLSKQYLVLPYGESYQRRLIQLPDDIEKYIGALGSKTRAEVRRSLRRINDEAAITFHVYSGPDEVPELLKQLQSLSAKTYQHKLLDLGISENDETYRELHYAAEKGWLRSHILFCNDEPVAFDHGFLHNQTYYSTHIGYDPKWTKSSVGLVTHIYTVKDLIEQNASNFDFMYGDSGNKARLSNTSHEEQNFYLIPRLFPLSSVARTLRLFNAIIDRLGRFLDEYGIKSKLRRFLRRKSTQS